MCHCQSTAQTCAAGTPALRRPTLLVAGLAIVLTLAACGGEAQRQGGPAQDLKQALSEVSGAYTWRADLDRFEYSEKARLEEILSAHPGEENVRLLVDCLDDTSPSHSSIDGTVVAVGIVCYEALTQTVYHEPTAANGDIAGDWPGNITPKASPQQMRDAKDAWTKVVETKTFTFQ